MQIMIELFDGRLRVDGEVLPIRRSLIRGALADYARRTGLHLWCGRGTRTLPRDALEWIIEVDREASLGMLEAGLADAIRAA